MQEVSNIQMRKLLTLFPFYAYFYRGDRILNILGWPPAHNNNHNNRGDKNEQNYCANPQQHQCGSDPLNDLNYQACPTTVPNGKRQAAECYAQQRLDSFQCLNRMDEYPFMFQQKLYKHKEQEESLSLNKHLDYNDTGVLCSEKDFIAWIDLDNMFGTPYCTSKYSKNRQIAGLPIWELLSRDFGFEGRKHIPESWLLRR